MPRKKRVKEILTVPWEANSLDGKEVWVVSQKGANFYLEENRLLSGCREAAEQAVILHNATVKAIEGTK